MNDVITSTLTSSSTLTITPTFDSGELLLAKLLLAMLGLLVLDLIFRMVYRQ